MPYQPALFTGAEDVHDVLTFVQRELSKIGQAINDKVLQPGINYVPPPKARDGNLAFADGTHWNPGNGAGVYAHINGAWTPLLDPAILLPVSVPNGGTGQITAAAARGASGLDIEAGTGVGDANYTILATDLFVYTTVTLTAPRTWTLPLASTVNAGRIYYVGDLHSGVNATNTISLAIQGGDTLVGAPVINISNSGKIVVSDGISRWLALTIKTFGSGAFQGLALDSSAKLPTGVARTPTRQYLKSGTAATYTTPANCTSIFVRMIGAGGGGGGASGAGGVGGDTIFNAIHAAGGSGGAAGAVAGGAGGTGGTGTADLRLPGSSGGPGNTGTIAAGRGGNGIFGMGVGLPPSTGVAQNGVNGGANTGAGGSGVFAGSNGSGGGGGEYVELTINNPAATYTYTIGAGGTAGSGTNTGGVGGTGLIIVEEFY